jgi:hypothetical protein
MAATHSTEAVQAVVTSLDCWPDANGQSLCLTMKNQKRGLETRRRQDYDKRLTAIAFEGHGAFSAGFSCGSAALWAYTLFTTLLRATDNRQRSFVPGCGQETGCCGQSSGELWSAP